jgi:hypothetical protein
MDVLSVNPVTDPTWHRLVSQHPSDVFHSPQWLRSLVETYGFDVRSLIIQDDQGGLKGGIPYGIIDDIMGALCKPALL